jgi:hypothetical protein
VIISADHRAPATGPGRLGPRPPGHREPPAPGPRRDLRRGPIPGPHRQRPTGHGHAAEHRDQPAPPRRRDQHRRSPTTSRPETRPTHQPAADLMNRDFAAAITQIRMSSSRGHRYYMSKIAEGKTPQEAKRCLKQRLADHVWRVMTADERRRNVTSPGGHPRATKQSRAAGSTPTTSSLDKPLPRSTKYDSTAPQPAPWQTQRHPRAPTSASIPRQNSTRSPADSTVDPASPSVHEHQQEP